MGSALHPVSLCRALAIGFVLPSAAAAAAPAREIKYSTIALSGRTIPDSGRTFGAFGPHTFSFINTRGDVLFEGSAEGAGGLWLAQPNGSIITVADPDTAAPGVSPGSTFSEPHLFMSGALNHHGQVIFQEWVNSPSGSQPGIWAGAPGSLQPVALGGQHAPGLPTTATFKDLHGPRAINDAGQVMISNGEPGDTGGLNEGLWVGMPGNLAPVALVGKPMPGGGNLIDFFRPEFNNRGEVAFHGIISISPEPQDRGIWFGTPGNLLQVARTGLTAPGTNGAVYTGIDTPDINNRGDIAYTGRFANSSTKGLWVGKPEAPDLVASTSSIAPGTGRRFGHFHEPMLNDAGDIALYAHLQDDPGNSSFGLFTGTPNQLRLIMLEGQPVPGAPDGVTFRGYPNDYPRLNTAGQIAVRLFVAGPGIDATNNHGIWATDHSGDLRLVAREGDLFDVGDGDMRRIVDLGNRWDMNEHGQVVFSAKFADGSSGIFVANVFPEPNGLLLAAGAALVLGRRRR